MLFDSCKECIENETSVITVVNALRQWCDQNEGKSDEKTSLFDEGGVIFLQISMKKIPYLTHLQNIKISLPHPCWNDPEDVCLFVPDLNKKKPDDDATIHHYRILLQNYGATVREIITLHQLKTEYSTFESRRRLVGSFSVFLCDGRLSRMMPTLLGKIFVQKRKMPISVDLRNGRNHGRSINAAISKTSLIVHGHGTSCGFQVANLNLTNDEIVGNVMAALKEINEKLPGSGANIASMHLKTVDSLAIPLYVSFESANNVNLPRPTRKDKPVIDELTTDDATSVLVYPSGRVIDFPSNEFGEEETDIEQKILRSTRAAVDIKSRRMSGRKKESKIKGNRNAITKRKTKTVTKKNLVKSMKFSLKSKKGYVLTEEGLEKIPPAKLLSVKKMDVDAKEKSPQKPLKIVKRNSQKLAKKSKSILKKEGDDLHSKKRIFGEQISEKHNHQKSGELKGILKKAKNLKDANMPMAKRPKKVSGKRKRDAMAVMRKSSLMAKHM